MAIEPKGESLHEHAVQAEAHLETLATGLAQQGAAPEAVQVISKMAGVLRKLITVLGKGQEQTGDQEPPEQEPQQQPQQPQQPQRPASIGSATQDLRSQMQAKRGY